MAKKFVYERVFKAGRNGRGIELPLSDDKQQKIKELMDGGGDVREERKNDMEKIQNFLSSLGLSSEFGNPTGPAPYIFFDNGNPVNIPSEQQKQIQNFVVNNCKYFSGCTFDDWGVSFTPKSSSSMNFYSLDERSMSSEAKKYIDGLAEDIKITVNEVIKSEFADVLNPIDTVVIKGSEDRDDIVAQFFVRSKVKGGIGRLNELDNMLGDSF